MPALPVELWGPFAPLGMTAQTSNCHPERSEGSQPTNHRGSGQRRASQRHSATPAESTLTKL